MKNIRVLVTGGGSGVGQGIIKALRISGLPVTVVSGDIAPLNAGLFLADEATLIPRVEDADALERFITLLSRGEFNVVMIGSEFDLAFFARHRDTIEARTGCKVMASPLSTVEIANDKWLTTEFLRVNGLPHAAACLPAQVDEAAAWAAANGYPVVLKSRTGTSSRNVHIVRTEADLRRLFSQVPNLMLQAFAGNEGDDLAHEYTCAVFRAADGSLLGPFTARRTLRGGSSWVVEVGNYHWLHPTLLAIGERIPSLGSLNIQLRDGPDGPIPFELNARFSGTTAVRAHFGFNEPAFALRSYLLGETMPQPQIGAGLALRYLEEVFLDGVAAADLDSGLPRGTVRDWT